MRFVPSIVRSIKTGSKNSASTLITRGFLIFEGILFFLCIVCMLKASFIIRLFAPGFSQEQILKAVPYLQILMPLILFYSSSSLLAGALQAVGHFFVPAFSQVLVNILYIASILICLRYNCPISYLCWFLVFGGFVQCVWHLITYFKLKFSFTNSDKTVDKEFKSIIIKFLWGLPSASFSELSLIIDTSFCFISLPLVQPP